MNIKLRSTFAVGSTQTELSTGNSGKAVNINLEPGATVRDLLRSLSSLGPENQWDDIMIHVFVNGQLRGYDYPLRNRDTVDLHIPVSGG